jgi:anti-sigma factor RsiW
MSCRRLTADVIDFARGAALDRAHEDLVVNHLRVCAECAALVERQRAMSRALRHLAEAQSVPPAGDARLHRLLDAFDAPRTRPRRLHPALEWSLAASVLIVAGLAVGWKNDVPAPTLPAPAGAQFVILPGANALPRFESGQVIRVDLPSPEGVITADVLVGQDGLARAVRLVQ